MPLTEKERRVITSPLSFLSKQRKTTKHRTRIKIQEILQDVLFLMENHSKVYEEFGIDVLKNTAISEHFSESNTKESEPSNDSDLL